MGVINSRLFTIWVSILGNHAVTAKVVYFGRATLEASNRELALCLHIVFSSIDPGLLLQDVLQTRL